MTWQAKVTPAMRKEMRTLWPEFTMRQIAARYGVSARTVWTMLRGVACQRRKMDDQEVLDMRAAYSTQTRKRHRQSAQALLFLKRKQPDIPSKRLIVVKIVVEHG